MSEIERLRFYALQGDVEALDGLVREIHRTNRWNTSREAGKMSLEAANMFWDDDITYRTLVEIIAEVLISVPVVLVAVVFPAKYNFQSAQDHAFNLSEFTGLPTAKKIKEGLEIRLRSGNGVRICYPDKVYNWIADHTRIHRGDLIPACYLQGSTFSVGYPRWFEFIPEASLKRR